MTDRPTPRGHWRRAVVRDPGEPSRVSTPLELFFDLCIVVAVAQAAHELEVLLVDHRYADALIGFATAFIALWWAWVNFTWFATAHDADDVPYRVLTFVQIAGALVMAGGVEAAMAERDFTVIVIGYVLMRIALVAQWWRVRATFPEHRERATSYAVGILAVQVLWIAWLAVPDALQIPGWLVLMAGEMMVPVIAERGGKRAVFHGEHVTERYSLLTIIVLGESIAATTVAVHDVAGSLGMSVDVAVLVGGALLVAFCAWWLYFERPGRDEPATPDTAFVWGYGHLIVFAALAALGAGVQLTAAWLDHHHASDRLASFGVAIPAAAYLVALPLLDLIARRCRDATATIALGAPVIVIVGALAPPPVTVAATAVVYVGAVVVLHRAAHGAPATTS